MRQFVSYCTLLLLDQRVTGPLTGHRLSCSPLNWHRPALSVSISITALYSLSLSRNPLLSMSHLRPSSGPPVPWTQLPPAVIVSIFESLFSSDTALSARQVLTNVRNLQAVCCTWRLALREMAKPKGLWEWLHVRVYGFPGDRSDVLRREHAADSMRWLKNRLQLIDFAHPSASEVQTCFEEAILSLRGVPWIFKSARSVLLTFDCTSGSLSEARYDRLWEALVSCDPAVETLFSKPRFLDIGLYLGAGTFMGVELSQFVTGEGSGAVDSRITLPVSFDGVEDWRAPWGDRLGRPSRSHENTAVLRNAFLHRHADLKAPAFRSFASLSVRMPRLEGLGDLEPGCVMSGGTIGFELVHEDGSKFQLSIRGDFANRGGFCV